MESLSQKPYSLLYCFTITRAILEAQSLGVTTTTPMIGQVNSFQNPIEDKNGGYNTYNTKI